MISGNDAESKALQDVCKAMCVAARTAPKGCGVDNLITCIIDTEEEKESLSKEMRRMATIREENDYFIRDANSLKEVQAIVVIAIKNNPLLLPDCSYCGFENCYRTKNSGGRCSFNSVDLGIAIGSAVSVANMYHVDNRVMFSIGKTILNLGWLEDACMAFGIPLSVSSKNPFFDR